jgi:DNA-binding MarR family transcriptional regulator
MLEKPADAPIDGVESITASLETLLRLHASRKVVKLQGDVLQRQVSQPGLTVLRRLDADGPLPMGELARATNMDGGAAARLASSLEAEGLLVRTPSPDDGRVSIVRVSAAGARLSQQLSALLHQHMLDSLAGWTTEEIETFADSLGRFVTSLRRTGFSVPPSAVVGPESP